MQHPTTHRFLVWFGPSVVVFLGGCLGLAIAAAQVWPGVKSWTEAWYAFLYPVMSAPWFVAGAVVSIGLYIWALVWTGKSIPTPPLPQQRTVPSASDLWFRRGIDDEIERQSLNRKAKWATDRAVSSAVRMKALLGPDFETLEDQVAGQKADKTEIRRQAIITEAERNRASGQKPAWIPLCDALRYLVYETQWAEGQTAAKDKDDFDRRVSVEFLEHLARGEIEARGKLGWTPESRLRATETIGGDFWVTAFIQPHGEIVLAAPDTQGTAGSKGTSDTCYMGVIVRKEQVEAVWPAGVNTSANLTELAKFIEPQRAQIAKERSDAGK